MVARSDFPMREKAAPPIFSQSSFPSLAGSPTPTSTIFSIPSLEASMASTVFPNVPENPEISQIRETFCAPPTAWAASSAKFPPLATKTMLTPRCGAENSAKETEGRLDISTPSWSSGRKHGRVAIYYSGEYGKTAKIAHHLKQVLVNFGLSATKTVASVDAYLLTTGTSENYFINC